MASIFMVIKNEHRKKQKGFVETNAENNCEFLCKNKRRGSEDGGIHRFTRTTLRRDCGSGGQR